MNTQVKTVEEIKALLLNDSGGILANANLSIIATLPINEGDAIRLCVTKGDEGKSDGVEFVTRTSKNGTGTFYQFEIRRNNSGSWRKMYFSLSAILRMPLKRCYWRGDDKQELLEFLDRSCLHKDSQFIGPDELIDTLCKGVVAQKIYRDIAKSDTPSPKCICFRAL